MRAQLRIRVLPFPVNPLVLLGSVGCFQSLHDGGTVLETPIAVEEASNLLLWNPSMTFFVTTRASRHFLVAGHACSFRALATIPAFLWVSHHVRWAWQ